MLIPTDELGALVRRSALRAVPRERRRTRELIHTIERTGLVADSESASSRRLAHALGAHASVLGAGVLERFDEVVLFGVDVDACDAIPHVGRGGQRQIVVFDGLVRLIAFSTELTVLCDLLQRLENAPELELDDGERWALVDAVSVAGHRMMIESCLTGHTLLDLGVPLGPNAATRVRHGFGAGVIFVLLHELGHHVGGHLEQGYVSERAAVTLPIEEPLSALQRMELEADRFALEAFAPAIRLSVLSSVHFALAPFAFLETFVVAGARAHPLTVNRLAALSARAVTGKGDPALEDAVGGIVDAALERFRRLARERAAAGGDLWTRSAAHVPLERAYGLLAAARRVIDERLGQLDFPSV